MTPPALWDTLKATIIAISSYEKKMRQQKLKYLDDKLKKRHKEHSETLKDKTQNYPKLQKLKKRHTWNKYKRNTNKFPFYKTVLPYGGGH